MSATKATATKPTTTKAKAPVAKKVSSKTAPTHPSWAIIIIECIVAHKEEARAGVSRQTIKKFAEEKYKLKPTAANLSRLSNAISRGAKKGTFNLPKGKRFPYCLDCTYRE